MHVGKLSELCVHERRSTAAGLTVQIFGQVATCLGNAPCEVANAVVSDTLSMISDNSNGTCHVIATCAQGLVLDLGCI